MKPNKILIYCFVSLAIAVIVLFYAKSKGSSSNTSTSGSDTTKEPESPLTKLENSNKTIFPLKEGSTGKAVKLLQLVSGVAVDGKWGPKSSAAIHDKFKIDSISAEDFVKGFSDVYNSKSFPLKEGSKVGYVQVVQIILNLKSDGIYGKKTALAVMQATGSAQLTADGYMDLIRKLVNS